MYGGRGLGNDYRRIGTFRRFRRFVAFGGEDLRTMFVTAVTSVYTLRVKTPGLPHPFRRSLPRRPMSSRYRRLPSLHPAR